MALRTGSRECGRSRRGVSLARFDLVDHDHPGVRDAQPALPPFAARYPGRVVPGEGVDQGERGLEVGFGTGVWIEVLTVEAVVDQAATAVVDRLIDGVATVEPGAGVGGERGVAGLVGRRGNGIEGANRAADIKSDGGEAVAEGVLDGRDEDDLNAGAGPFDQVGTVEGPTNAGQSRFLQVSPEVNGRLAPQVGQQVAEASVGDLFGPGDGPFGQRGVGGGLPVGQGGQGVDGPGSR